MKHAVVLLGFAFVGIAIYAALSKRDAPEPSGVLPQPPAPGLNPSV